MRIDPVIAKLPNLGAQAPASGVAPVEQQSEDFAQMLMDVLREVSETQHDARSKQNALMTGQRVEYHDLMIAMEKASVAMQLTIAVRNKILEAYQEIQRIQV